MFRLLYQYLTMKQPEWQDSNDIELLREQRLDMLRRAEMCNVRWTVAPFIQSIEKDKGTGRWL